MKDILIFLFLFFFVMVFIHNNPIITIDIINLIF